MQTEHDLSHGPLLTLAAIYTVYRQRLYLQLIPNQSALATLTLLGLSLAWGLSYLMGIQAMHQTLALMSLACAYWAWLGLRRALPFLLGLSLLIWALPIWFLLNPPLQAFASWAVKWLLQWAHIPAFIEGIEITIPSGRFEISGGCSGLRYLLVSSTLASIYGIFYLRSFPQTLILWTFGCALSILFNWIRIFIIIWVGHDSKMQSSLVQDHDNFGWFLYIGVVIPILWVARRLEKSSNKTTTDTPPIQTSNQIQQTLQLKPWLHTICLLSLPALLTYGWQSLPYQSSFWSTHTLPNTLSEFHKTEKQPDWRAAYQNHSHLREAVYQNDTHKTLTASIFHYQRQQQGQELINEANFLTIKPWVNKQRNDFTTQPPSGSFLELRNLTTGKKRLLLRWYTVSGQNTTNDTKAKLLQFKGIFTRNASASLVTLSIPCKQTCSEQEATQLSTVASALLNYNKR